MEECIIYKLVKGTYINHQLFQVVSQSPSLINPKHLQLGPKLGSESRPKSQRESISMDFHYLHAPKLISSMSVGLYYSLKVASKLNVPPTGLCP